MALFTKELQESLRRVFTDDKTATKWINFFTELSADRVDATALTAKMDTDTGIAHNDYSTTTGVGGDSDPFDGK